MHHHHQPSHSDDIQGRIYDWKLTKRLLHYVRPYTGLFLLSICLMLIVSSLELVGPYLVKEGIDLYIKHTDLSGLNKIGLIFLFILIIKFLAHFLENYYTHLMGQRVIRDLRMELFSHVQSLSFSFFDHYPVGKIMTRIGNDIEVLEEMLSAGIVSMLGDILSLIGIVIIMLWMEPGLALISFSVFPLVAFGTIKFKNKVRQAFREIRDKIARLNSFMQENISGIKEVQIFGREEHYFRRFSHINAEHRDAYLKAVFCYALFFPYIEILASVSTALIIWYGGAQAFRGVISIGLLVAFIEYMGRFFRPIRELSEKYNLLQSTMASAERIFALMDDQQKIIVSVTPRPFPGLQQEIVFDRVWFAYQGDDYVLQDVSFRLNKGDILAVVGATGAGKTTIINLLGRHYDIQRGRIMIDGLDIREYDLNDLRRAMALVQQDVFLFSDTILYNITLDNPSIDFKSVQQIAEYINAAPFINNLPANYHSILSERGNTLSGGQRQLLAFARAMAHNPDILILDEATSSIDSETEGLIQDALPKLMQNRTSIIIAHRISTIIDADQILVLHQGKVKEQGTHAVLLRDGVIYKRWYEMLERGKPF